ncbi:MAG: lysophospholipid acyltransferase family protein [Verrucomicrobia bacterium]|nr:lysophospholipid acyltransferase family protein [Verrucomicrobiota bacterium]
MIKNDPNRRLAALASASNDGAFLSVILQSYGVHAVRGSSSRRGSQAMKELITLLRKGYDLSLTPDGPRGPKYQMQSGVISLAQLTGKPIIPVSSVLSLQWTLKTWDAFQIPIPFAKCVFNIGNPVYVDRDLSIEQRDALAIHIANEMIRLGDESID